MTIYPIQDLLEVLALMRNVEIWIRIVEPLNPIISNYCYIRVAHNDLSENFDTMI